MNADDADARGIVMDGLPLHDVQPFCDTRCGPTTRIKSASIGAICGLPALCNLWRRPPAPLGQ
jgi:hypothetical protein